MKKKNQTSSIELTGDTAAAAITTFDGDEIKTLINNHACFFDKLIEAIPPRFYLPSNDDKPWFQGLSKAAKASAKRKTIENLRNARQNRFDPEKSSRTTLDFLKASLENESSENNLSFGSDGGDDGDDDEEEENEGRLVTYEELQMKMRRKLEALKAGRSVGEGGERRREKREAWKRKRTEFEGEKEKGKAKAKSKEIERVNVEKEVDEAVKEIEFGKVKLAASVDDALFNKKNKKRKLSKEEELKKARELEEAKKDPEKGNIVKTQHAWKAATERAMGNKVHDNPSRLQKSLDSEMRKQKKSKETWQKRLDTTENQKKAKQEKRKANINAKLNSKKQAKIAKREKKFMRPGFEGRKEGFITRE
ncbi:hypothetical protein RND81_08G219800 [Saponaria officinalis]|uniref:Surfeit locus protein 6 n=1 Tax=Saponaria officinalis TaxID=3572 RepID=A0AAW1J9J3_SAPOF